MIALIDGDIIAYRCAVGSQEDWDGETIADLNAAIREAVELIDKWTREARCKKPIICLSPKDGSNFRKTLMTDYKTHRKDKPLCYWELIDYIEKNYKVQRIEGLEADDVMGIMATSDKIGSKSVVVTIDKDLKTVPCNLFNPSKDTRPRRLSNLEADRFWMFQTLTGDPTDGFKGCPGIGPKKAEALLSNCSTLGQMWQAVTTAYREKSLTEADATLNARMARILRREDYDKQNNRIRLWHPMSPKWMSLSDAKAVPSSTPDTKVITSGDTDPVEECVVKTSRTSSKPSGAKTRRRSRNPSLGTVQ